MKLLSSGQMTKQNRVSEKTLPVTVFADATTERARFRLLATLFFGTSDHVVDYFASRSRLVTPERLQMQKSRLI